MKKSEGIRAVTEWEAERELLQRGYTKQPCPECKGAGHFPNAAHEDADLLAGAGNHFWGRACDACEGQGWRWRAPAVSESPS